mmetsp:Transcript_71090/g.206149  ORF Transcript_71090/g.206149 Transcript_71090/m.206149 type:complete len:346 (+) Transcript_71090:327-1364(+)
MKVSLQHRSSSGAQSLWGAPEKAMCTAWNTNLHGKSFTAKTPFVRKMSTPLSLRSQPNQSFNLAWSTSPLQLMPTEVTLSSCWWSALSSRKASSISRILSKENALMPKMKSMSTSLYLQRLIWTASLIILIRRSTSANSSSVAKSVLFSRILSAKATCSTASFSTPSGFSSSKWLIRCLASTTVRMPSKANLDWMNSSAKKVWATGAGSASPVVSIITASIGLFVVWAFLTMRFSPAIKSPRTVQQMQPLFISTMFSSVVNGPASRRASSMPTSPNSFSMTATRFPWFSLRMRLSNVVLPLPRKPVITVTGILSIFFGPCAAASAAFCFSANAAAPSGTKACAAA